MTLIIITPSATPGMHEVHGCVKEGHGFDDLCAEITTKIVEVAHFFGPTV